jgi:superfamily II DNA or RNA helicase
MSKFDFTILDEVHRYASEMNSRPLKFGNLGYKLGLTATLRRSDNLDVILRQMVGPVVYTITKNDAIEQDYICNYEVFTVPCSMNEHEYLIYNRLDQEAKEYMGLFNNNFNSIHDTIKSGPRNTLFQHAVKAMKAIQARRGFTAKVESKSDEAVKLCIKHPNTKIILFDELQDSANKIHKTLMSLGVPSVLYHSGIKGKAKKAALKEFIDGKIDILISVRALDEGLDVKDISIGIIVNGNSQEKQILQRLGRLLRKREGKIAQLYMLFAVGTQDEKYMSKRLNIIQGDGFEEIQYGK